jgi:hypothetical protein
MYSSAINHAESERIKVESNPMGMLASDIAKVLSLKRSSAFACFYSASTCKSGACKSRVSSADRNKPLKYTFPDQFNNVFGIEFRIADNALRRRFDQGVRACFTDYMTA